MLISLPVPAPFYPKSKRQLRFTQPIELALGGAVSSAKTKKQKSSGLYSGNSKEVQAM